MVQAKRLGFLAPWLSSAISDSNKQQLVEQGILPILENALVDHFSDTSAINEVVNALLLLSFSEEAASWMRGRLRAPLGMQLHKLADGPGSDAADLIDESDFLDFSSATEVAHNLLFVLKKGPAEVVVRANQGPHIYSTTLESAKRSKHVMVSYCWKQKELVIKLVEELERLGLVVWRDEVGTEYAPALHGNTAAAMAAAIEFSFCVIVCVSREYYESGNCRLEACYAWGCKERGELEMLFVMTQAGYTTKSKPDHITGWLGLYIGQDLWYPLWAEQHAPDTAAKLANRLGGGQLLPVKAIAPSAVQSLVKPDVPSIFPVGSPENFKAEMLGVQPHPPSQPPDAELQQEQAESGLGMAVIQGTDSNSNTQVRLMTAELALTSAQREMAAELRAVRAEAAVEIARVKAEAEAQVIRARCEVEMAGIRAQAAGDVLAARQASACCLLQ
jgi:hypothetical protein